MREAQRYQQQQKEQEQLVSTMRGVLRQLEVKISEVDTTLELLLARKRNALLQQRVYDALNKTGGPKEKERANRAQDGVKEAEARAHAMAELHNLDQGVQLQHRRQEQSVVSTRNDIKAKNLAANEPPS